jgi:hypothetical protein
MVLKMMKPLLSVATPAHWNKSMLSTNTAGYGWELKQVVFRTNVTAHFDRT